MEDPLQDLFGLSLFPCNISLPFDALKSIDGDDLEAVHEFMTSLELQSQEKCVEQAKSVVDRNRELLKNTDFSSSLTGNNQCEAGDEDGKEILRGRRPGLGRKKAQFKMIPNLSQSSKPVRDEELSKDPKEFFAHFERREMAEKELRRLRGETVTDGFDFNAPRPERRRRPGILGKTVTYKHLYPPLTLSQDNEPVISSQETMEEGLQSPEAVVAHAEVEKELTGSIAATESTVNTLFDELFARKDLNEAEMSSLILEHLQIKPTIIDEIPIPIPVFNEPRKSSNFRTALADIQNFEQTVGSSKALAKDKQVANFPLQTFVSSPPSTSPLAPISAFQKHIQRSNMPKDLFSALDLSLPINSSSQEDDTVDNPVSSEMITDRNKLQYDKSLKSYMAGGSTDDDSGFDVGNEMLNNVADVGEETVPFSQVDVNVESSSGNNTDYQTAGLDENDKNVEAMPHNAEPIIDDDSNVERMKNKDLEKDHTNPATGESSDIAEFISEQQTQNMEEPSEVQLNDKTTPEIPSEMPLNDQNKAKVPSRRGRKRKEANTPLEVPLNDQAKEVPPEKARKRKEFSRRNSLAGAGTRWEEGKRKSCRIRSRPLEYWKGEKFLYGRVHESLTTIIGIKYASPGAKAENRYDEKPKLKVKSFVSSEHEELVKLRSLY